LKKHPEGCFFWSKWRDSNSRHPRLRRRFAVPDKNFGLALILVFIDRCTQTTLLHLPPAAQSGLAQSRYPALFAGCRIRICTAKNAKRPAPRGSSLCVAMGYKKDIILNYSIALNPRIVIAQNSVVQ